MKLLWRFLWTAFITSIIVSCVVDHSTLQVPSNCHWETRSARRFQKDRYFFLDNLYRRYYIRKYAPQGFSPAPPPEVTRLSVWRSFDGWNTEKKPHIKDVKVDTIDQLYAYERLERDKHYYLDDAEGWIRFNDSISLLPQQQIAIFMRTDDSTAVAYSRLQKGSMKIVTRTDSLTFLDTVWTLWTLRPMAAHIVTAEDDTSRFNLMWRHAYGPIDFSDPASFELAVKRINDDINNEKVEQVGATFFTEILGIADKNNKPYITNAQIFNRQFNDLIFPPFDTSWAGLDVFNNPQLGDSTLREVLIYRYSLDASSKFIGYRPIYEIDILTCRQ